MHVLGKTKMPLLVSILGSVGVAGLVLATVTGASAAPSGAAAAGPTEPVNLNEAPLGGFY